MNRPLHLTVSFLRRLFPTLLVCFSFYTTDAQSIIQLQELPARKVHFAQGQQSEVQLCNLTPGTTYYVTLTPDGLSATSPVLQASPLYELVNDYHFSFTATKTCLPITIFEKFGKYMDKVPVVLSISRPGGTTSQSLFPPAISTNSGVPVSTLITETFIGGDCYEVFNISSQGSGAAFGTFSNGMTSIGLPEGMMISSGNIANATGPNNATNASTNFFNLQGDPDLQQIVANNGNLRDVAVIEFDFTPSSDMVQFDYVFASEEYCDFVNSTFNDVFGFFISGPGINGPYTNNAINIALIPGTANEVTINDVNHISNNAYYIGNIPAGSNQLNDADCNGHPTSGPPSTQDCQFDGYTTVLTAMANVIPCETYHIKLAVADVSDGIYDSAVFLAANSFDSGGNAAVEGFNADGSSNIIQEGCGGGYFLFTRDDDDLSMPLTLNFEILIGGNNATAGTDYETLPFSVTIPAGQMSVQLPVDVFPDDILEGLESIILLLDNPCQCSNKEIELFIQDTPPLELNVDDQEICASESVTLSAGPGGGVPPYTFNWSNGSNGSSINVNPMDDTEYYVTITDDCGNERVDTAMVTVLEAPTASVAGSAVLCANDTDPDPVEIEISFTGDGPWEVVYTLNGVPQPPITTSDNPYILLIDEPGTVSLSSVEATGAGGCPGTVSGQADIMEVEIAVNPTPTDVTCNGEGDGSINVSVSGGTAPYTFNWDNGIGDEQNPGDLDPGTYNVTVVDANGCEESASVTIQDPPELTSDVTEVGVDCNNPNGSISVNPDGGTAPYDYTWDDPAASGQNPSNLPPGTYNVTITDANGCETTNTATVEENLTPPTAIANAPDILTCANTEISIDGNGSSTGPEFSYGWTGPGIVSGGNTLNPEVNAPGTYTLTVTNNENGCEEMVSVTVGQDITPPVATGVAPTLTCAITEVTISGIGSSVGPDFSYNWTGPGIVSGGNTLNPTVNQAGTYELTVTNDVNGCTNSVNVNVPEDVTPPVVVASGGAITCVDLLVILDGSSSSGGPGFTYEWDTNDGNIISGGNTPTPLVDQAGTYTFTVTDGSNGCEATTSVTVGLDNQPPVADAGPPLQIDCSSSTVTLDGSGSGSGAGIIYNWSTMNGNILSGGNGTSPTVNQEGTYTLTVTNTNNGCINTAQVDVTENISFPTAAIIPPPILTCDLPEVILDGSPSTAGSNITYQWTTPSGNILSGNQTNSATVNAPGVYFLTVTNTDNQCTGVQSIFVDANQIDPIANAGPPQTLTCAVDQLILQGFNSSVGPDFTYQWVSSDGNIVSGGTTLTPTVDQPGTYELIVTNNDNGCTSSSLVTIDVDESLPVADAGASTALTCFNPTVNLNGGNSSSGPNITYSWTTSGGNIISGGNTLNPLIDQPGTYQLTVFNNENGCTTTSSVQVADDIIDPTIDVLPPGVVDCYEPIIQLDASGSSNGSNMSPTWSTTNGNIVDGQFTLTPTVDAGGTYILTLFNSDNGCSTTEVVMVDEQIDNPELMIAPAAVITCAQTSVALSGIGSSEGPNFSYSWTTSDGNILSGANSLEPVVAEGGTYQLTILNADNNCSSTGTVEVIADNAPPTIDPATPAILNCTVQEVQLNATLGGGTNLDFTWSTTNGNFVADTNSLSPIVNAPGTYQIQVTNLDNACENDITVQVSQDIDLPIADAGAPNEVNCFFPSIQLDGTNSEAGSQFSYQWTTTDGNIIAGANTLEPEVDAPGTYVLTVLNQNNTCTSEAAVLIQADFNDPLAEAGSPQVLGCTSPTLLLSGTGSSTGNAFVYQWQTANGNILNGAQGLNPEIDAPGIYELTVQDTTNGCEAIDLVTVIEDLEEPAVDAGPGDELTCVLTEIQLQALASGNLDRFVYTWSTVNGNIVSGQGTLDPIVDAAGVYQLMVVDTINGCTAMDEVTITQDADVPVAQVTTNGVLNCVNNTVLLDGSNSSQSSTITYQWNTTTGNIVTGATSLTPTIDAPGVYVLTLTDSSNDCVSTASINVQPDTLAPIVSIASPGILNCYTPSISLTGNVNTGGDGYTFEWNTNDGSFTGSTGTLQPVVNASGTYQFQVTNLDNGCVNATSIQVNEDFEAPFANIGPPLLLTCDLQDFNLSALAHAQGAPFDYSWSTDGNIVAGAFTLNPLVNAPGTYELTVQNEDNGCETVTQVVVDQDIVHPDAEAGAGTTLNCELTEFELNGGLSSTGLPYSYQWTTSDGNIIASPNSLQPIIDAPGTYFLTVSNNDNGCETVDSVLVDENVIQPDIATSTPDILTCTELEVPLNLEILNAGTGSMEILWTTNNGNIVSGATTAQPAVDQPGAYQVFVTNLVNQCSNTLTVPVNQNVDYPLIDAGPGDLLTCAITDVQLDGTNSEINPNFVYNWTTNDGNISQGGTTLEPTVNAPGAYILSILDPDNDCVSLDTVAVDIDIVPPTAEAGGSTLLTCEEDQLNLDAGGSSQGINYTYQWSTNDGNILNGGTTLSPTIDAPGWYTVLVQNTDNGCTSMDSIQVTEDVNLPVVAIANPATLTCAVQQLALDASGSSQGTDFVYQWTTSNGNILNGSTTLNPNINEPGDYVLQITNLVTGCVNDATAQVDQNIVSPTASIAPADTLTCTFTDVSLSGTASGNSTDLSYQWTTGNGQILSGANTLNPVVAASATYTLEVTDQENGCTESVSVFVPENTVHPVVSIANPAILNCATDAVTLNAQGSSNGNQFTILWTTSNGNIIGGQQSLLAEVNEVGNYQLTIVDEVNGCFSSQEVSVNGDFEIPTVNAGEDFVLPCFEDFSLLDGTAEAGGDPISILWETTDGQLQNGQQTLTPSIAMGGTYLLTIQNLTNGCTNEDEVVVIEDVPLAPQVLTDNPPCLGDLGSILVEPVTGGTPPYVYSIDGGDTFVPTTFFAQLDPGGYSILVQDANGCETPIVPISIPQPQDLTVNVEPRVELLLGDSYQLDAQVNVLTQQLTSISWTPSETLTCDDCLDPVATPLETTTYEITVVSDLGCQDRGLVEVVVDRRPAVYIPNGFSPDNDGVNDVFMIFARDESIKEIKRFLVFSRWGETVYQYYNFQPNNPAYGWDGRHRGELMNPAVFAWFAEIEFIDGRTELFEGDVTLVR